jgi:hypothetical protein
MCFIYFLYLNIFIINKMDLPKIKTDNLEKELIQKYKLEQKIYDAKRYLKIKEELKQKYIENREVIREKQKEYYNNNKQKYKDYYIKNADRRIEYSKNYKLEKKKQIKVCKSM